MLKLGLHPSRNARYAVSLARISTLLTASPRQDLIQLGQSVKAYFSITRAVAGMYNYVHQMYFDQGLELLHDLSLASTNAMRAARQRALETYCLRVATEIEVYVEGVGTVLCWCGVLADGGQKKTRIIEELRGTMVGVAGRSVVYPVKWCLRGT